ncbi:hypothetical protein ACIBCA_35205 [Kitasatospora sp. NPDC051170]|uniref:hypothetical protein n=1 Tax=Kitasatospora sp. NPDC051170 TaxID=3364056 RepID=UPI0037BB81D2
MTADGNWHLTLDSSMGKQEFVFALKTAGSALSGTATAEGREIQPDIFDGSVDGDTLVWKLKVRRPVKLTMTFTMTVNGDSISGKAKAGIFGSYPVTGRRI